MSETNPIERLEELLTDEMLGQLSPEDRAELESLRESHDATGDNDYLVGELLVALDSAGDDQAAPPPTLVTKLKSRGAGIVAGDRAVVAASMPIVEKKASVLPWLLAAACIAIAVGGGIYAYTLITDRDAELESRMTQIAQLESRIEDNQAVIARARIAQDQLESELARSTDRAQALEGDLAEANEQARGLQTELAAKSARSLELAEQLAQATSDLDEAQLAIASYEQPVDPAELAANRRKLLEVPDTVRLAWQPFDLPDSPAQIQDIQGDVVWNDELETGYLRFVGLPVNDPAMEQYQVWVIDERGMEQKVSGGVFNATAQGEVIVPIDPAIDVGRVALFAITVEDAGGTWVPDLRRRVVVAPRDAEG